MTTPKLPTIPREYQLPLAIDGVIDWTDIDRYRTVLDVILPRIREAYYALLEGRRPEVIEFDAGNGVRRKVQYSKADIASLRAELSRLEAVCGRQAGMRRRFGLRAGGGVLMPGHLLRLSHRLLNTPLVITHPLGTPRFDRFGRVQARVARMTSKGFAPLSRAVSIVVRTSASAFAAHMAR